MELRIKIMRLSLFAAVVVCLSVASYAQAKPKLVYAPLNSAGNVPTMVAKKRGKEFQAIIGKSATVVPSFGVTKSLKTLKQNGKCQTINCGQKLSEALSSRFVLFTSLSNEDDTYTVELKLYDVTANGFVGASKKNCEFCAAREVKGTFATAWKEVTPYLSKPPVKTKAEPKKNGPAKLSILTIPPVQRLNWTAKLYRRKPL